MPGMTLGTARLVASGAADVSNDSLRESVGLLVEVAENYAGAYRTEYAAYEHYGDLLREKISYTERLHSEWKRDTASPIVELYQGTLPFTPAGTVPFPTDIQSFFRDRQNFTLEDGLFDTASDFVIMLNTIIKGVKGVREQAEAALR